MPPLRSDAARSRSRILDVARRHDPQELRMNDLAREAGVGVGTVYRHFPTMRALLEALTADTLGRMQEISRRAAAEPDPGEALALYLGAALELQLEDGGLQSVLLSPEDETEGVRAAKEEIFAAFKAVLARAKSAGIIRSELTLPQLSHLVCGIEHAVRLGTPEDRKPMLAILLAGLRP
ncbi:MULTISPECIES: TetR/AcrR family transcriptional regulator [unclassified Arthrobacter]|uniref:TetR/AcrR family transcriptional regulator n=1 Tax=unclassified Arthrobacter TaxID=235627 RepID=UPI001D15338D|nr:MULTISPECIES: TetR/AcrR family transcriptional regulator [unclassified Arthrobacter]MCC3275139.1 TetR/AcrR family transcriptional regulator [Arthrobacter sp. zg-Y20]MCC3278216.1 TetR/AcrR family transcriptional regulator [Arthrobacter sp. zg-Y40]MCC9176586.1 TetR/AcrR family transcriptional regulator [Arthrobacter sp. zg-Y750]MDK1315296.1 helix-turn-helix domain-containing protein [Arthrobacter sp. zg.Y20]MDK1326711.1 helix-turn-helix domain-containing protein [Arthrobacter sp. zg-Y1143]